MPLAASKLVRNTGFIVLYAVSADPVVPPALARFDAVVFIRTSCADIARPATWKIVMGWLDMPYSPFSARVIWPIRPFRNDSVV